MPMPSQVHLVAAETIRAELDTIQVDLVCARAILLQPPPPAIPPRTASQASFASEKSSSSAKSNKSSKTINTIKTTKNPGPKAFFGKVTAGVRSIRSRAKGKKYDHLEETQSLMSSDRRGSGDSDDTLVESVLGVPLSEGIKGLAQIDSAGHMLEVLAPLISALQRLTPRLIRLQYLPEDLRNEYAQTSDKIAQLLIELEQRVKTDADGEDTHDIEMSLLMLDALRKKVDKEHCLVVGLSALNVEAETDEETMVDNDSEEAKEACNKFSPLLPPSQNPFIVLSTSITLTSARRSSIGVPINAQAPLPGTYSGFVGGAQQTWARNVIRIGSYQNSMLFSPSPVAVKPLVKIS